MPNCSASSRDYAQAAAGEAAGSQGHFLRSRNGPARGVGGPPFALFDNFAQGVRRFGPQGLCPGTSYGPEERASHQVTASAGPLLSPPPRPVCVLPPLHSSGWTEPQREPRLSPGSLSPERSPSLSVTAVCAFLFFFFRPHPRLLSTPASAFVPLSN